MGKADTYACHELPCGVVSIVKAILADYRRRENRIRRGNLSVESLRIYVALNAAIDKALEDVEIGVRRDILNDLCQKRGYDGSPCGGYMGKNTYYRRKRKLVFDIAKALHLI